MDIWIPVIVAIISGLTSYILSVRNTKNKISLLEKENEAKMTSMEKEYQHKIDLMTKEIELQGQREQDAGVNKLSQDFMEKQLDKGMGNLEAQFNEYMEREMKKAFGEINDN